MFSPIYSAGGVYVPKNMYVPFRGVNPAMLNYYPAMAAGGLPMRVPQNFYGPAGASALGGDGPAQMRKLFIGGLNHETTDEQLREYYSQWGQVVDCIVIRDPVTKHSRGFGFVTFATIAMTEAAMADRPHTINGKVVDPKRAIPREQMLPLTPSNPPYFLEVEPATGCKLTLSGIHWDYHTVDGLRQYFEQFGEVEQVEILGHPRGFGFVVFEERSGVERCLQEGRTHTINGRKIDAKEHNEPTTSPSRRRNQLSASVASNDSSAATPESAFSEDGASNTSKSNLVEAGGSVGDSDSTQLSATSSYLKSLSDLASSGPQAHFS